jgi:hypothetical protein
LRAAGFAAIALRRRPAAFDLWAVARVEPMENDALQALALEHFPS